MAKYLNLETASFAVAADLSGNQYNAVKLNSTGQVAAVAATTANAVGILLDEPAAAGRAGSVAVSGYCWMEAGTSVGWTAGVGVGFDTTGRGIPRTVAGETIIGYFIPDGEASIVAGTIVTVDVTPFAEVN